jgi:hypothetical protein
MQRLSTPNRQRSLSSQSPSCRLHSFIVLSSPSFHLVFGLPLVLLPVGERDPNPKPLSFHSEGWAIGPAPQYSEKRTNAKKTQSEFCTLIHTYTYTQVECWVPSDFCYTVPHSNHFSFLVTYVGSLFRSTAEILCVPGGGKRIFPLSSVSRPALGPTQPPVQWVPGILSPGVKRGLGVTLTTHPF